MPTAAVAFAKAFPDRFIDLGIAEQNAVSFAAGLARMGLSDRASVRVLLVPPRVGSGDHSSRLRQSQRQGVRPLRGTHQPQHGATHQMVSDLAVMRSIPNMTVVEPADALEMSQALPAVVAHRGPVYFRLVRATSADRVLASCRRLCIQARPAALLREGTDVTLIGSVLWSPGASTRGDPGVRGDFRGRRQRVHDQAAGRGPDRRPRAADRRRGDRGESQCPGRLGRRRGRSLRRRLPVPLRRVGVRDEFGTSGPLEELFPLYGLTPEAVCEAARTVIRAKA